MNGFARITTRPDDQDADSILKAYIPEFLYKPPYGFPRKVNTPYLKQLAKTPYVMSIIKTIADEIVSIDWDIKVKEEYSEGGQDYSEQIKKIKRFLNNPNANDESFEHILRCIITDILECDSGVMVKVFNPMGELRQLYARDGSLFLKNPDIFGTMGSRADFVMPIQPEMFDNAMENLQGQPNIVKNEILVPRYDVYFRQSAAYFQYGWTAGSMPIPFGKREIIYFMSNPRGDSVYGRSPLEVLNSILLSLVYGAEFNLDFYTNNNMPEGVINLLGAEKDQIKQFRENFEARFMFTDDYGNKRKKFFNYPISSTPVEFTKFQLNPQEMDVIAQQQWFTKLVWMVYGVTADEMGFTENSNRAVGEEQTKISRRKAIKPLLKTLQYYINTNLITEFFSTPEYLVDFGDVPVEFCFEYYDYEEDKKKHDILQQEILMGIKTPEMVAKELGIDMGELERSKADSVNKEIDKQTRLNQSLNPGYGFSYGKENTADEQKDKDKKEENKPEQKATPIKQAKSVTEELDDYIGDFGKRLVDQLNQIP